MTTPLPIHSGFRALVNVLGGIEATAKRFSVTERTVRNWLGTGGPRKGPGRVLMVELLNRFGIAA